MYEDIMDSEESLETLVTQADALGKEITSLENPNSNSNKVPKQHSEANSNNNNISVPDENSRSTVENVSTPVENHSNGNVMPLRIPPVRNAEELSTNETTNGDAQTTNVVAPPNDTNTNIPGDVEMNAAEEPENVANATEAPNTVLNTQAANNRSNSNRQPPNARKTPSNPRGKRRLANGTRRGQRPKDQRTDIQKIAARERRRTNNASLLPRADKFRKGKSGGRRAKAGRRALAEIRHYQKQVGCVIPKAAFARLVRDITVDWMPNVRYQSVALLALQEATEAFMVNYFEMVNLAAIHAKRVTIQQKDSLFIKNILRHVGINIGHHAE